MLMIALIQKDTLFKWSEDADQKFNKLQTIFVTASILVQFDHICTTVMKTDSFNWCIEDTLLQLMNDVWRLCIYYLKKNALMK